ncbi:B3 domain-containing protein At2g33720-like [Solanum dulcamara]|uniref:B3 domain-containing protein At2g33720-like n=1 Tax=Solanum dulcamara TaxID=45834 RepID=UPI0024869CD5|nr:B3 domain-containing protein At2g33720-like [Solanum dulcamara]
MLGFLLLFFSILFSWELYPLLVSQKSLLTMKKTFFYGFFSSKTEEETCKVNNTPRVATRELVEIRDLYPAPKIDLKNPWQIKKKITRDEIIVGMLVIPFFETFEYIIRYWTLDISKSLENGCKVCVDVWDVTEENVPKKYEGGSVCLKKLYNDDYSLSCIELFSGLSVGDEIGLYWDPRSSNLMFKLLSHVHTL